MPSHSTQGVQAVGGPRIHPDDSSLLAEVASDMRTLVTLVARVLVMGVTLFLILDVVGLGN